MFSLLLRAKNTLTIPRGPFVSLFCPTPSLSPLAGPRTRAGVLPSARVLCVSVCVFACTRVACMCLCVCVCMRASLFWCVCVRVYVYVSVRACVRLRVRVCVYECHVSMYIHVCVCVCVCVRACECLCLSTLSTMCSQDSNKRHCLSLTTSGFV